MTKIIIKIERSFVVERELRSYTWLNDTGHMIYTIKTHTHSLTDLIDYTSFTWRHTEEDKTQEMMKKKKKKKKIH